MPTPNLPNLIEAKKSLDRIVRELAHTETGLEWQVHPAGGGSELRSHMSDVKIRKVKEALTKVIRAGELAVEAEELLLDALSSKSNPRRRRTARRR